MTSRIKKIIFWALFLIMVAGVMPWALVRLGNLWFAGNPAQARLAWTVAQFTSFYERDVIFYDIGNTHLAERNYDGAAEAYAAADNVATPKTRCPNRYNWGLTLMQKGDSSTDRDSARTAYSEGLRVISINDCQNDPAYKARFEALYAELLKRLKAVNEQPQEEQGSEQDSADREKAEELVKDDKQEKSAAKDYQNQRRFDATQEGDGSTSKFKFVW